MKKLLLLVLSFIFLMISFPSFGLELSESDKAIDVKLINCTSVDSIWVKKENTTLRIRLLAIDTLDGNLTDEINNYVCKQMKEAKSLKILYDEKSEKKDSYNRDLVWLYVDNLNFNVELVKLGYAEVNYIKGEYRFLNILCEEEKQAIIKRLGIWNYPDISEKYCKSGIKLPLTEESKEETTEETTNLNKKDLWYIVFLNSGILLLLIIFLWSRHEKK